MKNIKRVIAVGVLGICLSSAGCMIGPNDGDRVRNRDSYIAFSGVTLVGNERVDIQAKEVATGHWKTIASFHTVDAGANWDGRTWYWGFRSAKVPRECWKLHILGSVDRVYFSAEVRMVTESGYAMIGFERGFERWFYDNLESSPRASSAHRGTPDEFSEQMAGKSSVTIYTDVMAPGS